MSPPRISARIGALRHEAAARDEGWDDMATFLGADTAQLRAHGAAMGRGAEHLEALIDELGRTVLAVHWTGPDRDEFVQRWQDSVRTGSDPLLDRLRELASQLQQEADEQDACSAPGGSGGGDGEGPGGGVSPLDPIAQWLADYEPLESDGFFGDLLGGPEAGYWGNLGWSGVSIAGDIAGLVPEPTGVAAGVGLALDLASAGIGFYDAAQSFQDGDPFGTFDGLVTAGINLLDVPAGVLSLVPEPHVKVVGEALGAVTGSLDLGWSALTALAQGSAISGGPGEGSTSRFLVESPGWMVEQLTGSSLVSDATDVATERFEDGFGWASQTIRDAVPVLDPILDVPQRVVENAIPSGMQEVIEGGAGSVNEWIRDRMPW